MPALLGTTHPVGVLRRQLLDVFEWRLTQVSGPGEWTAEIHALLDVLQQCTLEACQLLPEDRIGEKQVCECVERAAFEGNPIRQISTRGLVRHVVQVR